MQRLKYFDQYIKYFGSFLSIDVSTYVPLSVTSDNTTIKVDSTVITVDNE